jgi:hypothetical protein
MLKIRNVFNTLNEQDLSYQLINTAYLDSLFRKFDIEGQKFGLIEIYRKYPDYQLDYNADEGIACADDIARALVFYCRQNTLKPNLGYLYKIELLCNFLIYMLDENAYANNFIYDDYNKNTAHINSLASPNFWTWRVFWAFTELLVHKVYGLEQLKKRIGYLLKKMVLNISNLLKIEIVLKEYEGVSIPNFIADSGSDQFALIMTGLCNLYEWSGSKQYEILIDRIARGLIMSQYGDKENFPHSAFMSWKNTWHPWGNIQAYALLKAGSLLKNNSYIESGLKEIKFLYPYLLHNKYLNSFSLRAKNTIVEAIEIRKFPQIAYDMRPMVWACTEAFRLTSNEMYAIIGANIALWLFGENAAGKAMYNPENGMCYDGIDNYHSVNLNSGAESTIEALLILNEVEKTPFMKKILVNYLKNNKSD